MIETRDFTESDRPVQQRLYSLAEAPVRGNFEWTIHWPGNQITHPLALDLLEIGKSTHMADRVFRRSFRLGQRTRRIFVRIPVSEPSIWTREKGLLEGLLDFATADDWSLHFCRSATPPRKVSREVTQRPFSVVALFSGGLDSLCGAAYLARNGAKPVFVSHSPPGRKNNLSLIRSLWHVFRQDRFSEEQCVSFRLEVRERNRAGRRALFQESSRRTRPVFFLALACAVAIDHGIREVQMSENGALGLSLPIRAEAYGAMCSRQAHDFLLRGFSTLMDRVAPRQGGWRVYNPFVDMTKGEACKLLDGAWNLARDAVSCEYVGRQAAFMRSWKKKHPIAALQIGDGPQCGLCVPCLIRRAALHKAGIPDPDRLYFFDSRRVMDWREMRPRAYWGSSGRVQPPLYSAAVGHVYHMRRFCAMLLGLKETEFALKFIPEIRLSLPPQSDVNRKVRGYHQLMRRLAREMIAFLDARR